MPVRGVIFDLDGTLVDSQLDFDLIRREMRLPDGAWILESVAAMPEGSRKDECLEILQRHEHTGAHKATPMPGIDEFLRHLDQRDLRTGVLTRNSREATAIVIERLSFRFDMVLTRGDAPPKPDPTGLLRICDEWGLPPAEVVFIGDFLFDLEAGRNAGMRTILYAPQTLPEFAEGHELVIERFTQAMALIESLG